MSEGTASSIQPDGATTVSLHASLVVFVIDVLPRTEPSAYRTEWPVRPYVPLAGHTGCPRNPFKSRETTMGTMTVRRPPQRSGPEMPQGEIVLQEPPAVPETSGGGLAAAVTYLPMAAASGAMMLIFIGPGTAGVGFFSGGGVGVGRGRRLF